MSLSNLPDGCTDADIEEHFGIPERDETEENNPLDYWPDEPPDYYRDDEPMNWGGVDK